MSDFQTNPHNSQFNDPTELIQLFAAIIGQNSLNVKLFDLCLERTFEEPPEKTRVRNRKVELLLLLGADVNYANENHGTLLMSACFNNQKDVVRMLLDRGVDVNAKDNCRRNALVYAANSESISIPELLIRKGVKIGRTCPKKALLKYIKDKIAKEKASNVLLCARKFCPDSFFHEEILPLDVFKIIFSESALVIALFKDMNEFMHRCKRKNKDGLKRFLPENEE